MNKDLADNRQQANIIKNVSETVRDLFGTEEGQTLHTRAAILVDAGKCILQDRNNSYGPPEDSFNGIGALWQAYWEAKGKEVLFSAVDVALMLDLMKTARLAANPSHADSWIDKAGYSACGGEIALKEVKKFKGII